MTEAKQFYPGMEAMLSAEQKGDDFEAKEKEAASFFLDKEVRSEKGPIILVAARDVGPVRALRALINEFPEIKSLYYLTNDAASQEVKATTEKTAEAIVDYKLSAIRPEAKPDIILSAGEMHPAMVNIITENFEHSKSTVVWLEDVPGSLRNRKGKPDLVFCFNDESAEIFKNTHPDVPAEVVHVLGLNPAFLKMRSENPKEIGLSTRKELNIADDAIVVTFIGSGAWAVPEDPGMLQELAEVLEELKQEIGREIVLIRRDHPGDLDPTVYDGKTENFFGRTISMAKGSDLARKFSTPSVACASDLLIGVSSTVFDEAAFRGALADKPGQRGTLVVHRHNRKISLPVIESGSALVAYSRQDFKDQIKKALFDAKTQEAGKKAQEKYCDVKNMQSNIKKTIGKVLEVVRIKSNPEQFYPGMEAMLSAEEKGDDL